MGEPIELVSPDGEPFTVYGRHEAAVYLAQGYQSAADVVITADNLSKLDGATTAIVQALTGLGLYTYAAVLNADMETLTGIKGVGKTTAEKLQASAKALM